MPKTSKPSLAPALLVALPDLLDPNFRRTVVLLLHHDAEGTLGLVLNRLTNVSAADLCESVHSDETEPILWSGDAELAVHWGGPVGENHGWVVAGEEALADVAGAETLGDGLHYACSVDALRRVAEQPPGRLRLFLGYAGWAPGQLEAELAQGAWVVAPLAAAAVFDVDEDELWDHAWRLLGIDPATIVSTPGVH